MLLSVSVSVQCSIHFVSLSTFLFENVCFVEEPHGDKLRCAQWSSSMYEGCRNKVEMWFSFEAH